MATITYLPDTTLASAPAGRAGRRIRLAFWIFALLAAATQAWVMRDTMSHDGVSYLDMASAVAHGDWAAAINGTAVGGGFEHVVKLTNFFIDMSHLPVFFEVRDQFVNTKAPPASTAIEIKRLAREGALFEVEAVAVIPDKAAKARAKRPAKKTAAPKRQRR